MSARASRPLDPAALAALDGPTVAARIAAAEVQVRPRAGDEHWQAATAVVLAPGGGPGGAGPSGPLEVAFIRRAVREGDPWSGDMALPGGRRDPTDPDLAATAARESAEEVGLALPAPVGRLDDQRGRTRRGVVASFVYVLGHRPPLHPAPAEVAEAVWIALPRLLDPAAATRHRWHGVPFPAIEHEGRVIWGLTHRIVTSLGQALASGASGASTAAPKRRSRRW